MIPELGKAAQPPYRRPDAMHQHELREAWRLAVSHAPLLPIAPLE